MTKKFTKLAALIMVIAALMVFAGMQVSATDTETETIETLMAFTSNTYVDSQDVFYEITDTEAYTLRVIVLTYQKASGDNLEEVIIAEQYLIDGVIYTVTEIESAAFFDCDNLTTIVIPSSVTEIGYNTFYSCDSLTTITIPDSVTFIGEKAFGVCENLTTVNYTGTQEQFEEIIIQDSNTYLTNATIVYNYGVVADEDENSDENENLDEDEDSDNSGSSSFFDQIFDFLESIGIYITAFFESIVNLFTF